MDDKLGPESMNVSILRYNSPNDHNCYTGSNLEQSIKKSTGRLKYCERLDSVYEIGYDNYWKETVIFKYPCLWKRQLKRESSPEEMRVVEWY